MFEFFVQGFLALFDEIGWPRKGEKFSDWWRKKSAANKIIVVVTWLVVIPLFVGLAGFVLFALLNLMGLVE